MVIDNRYVTRKLDVVVVVQDKIEPWRQKGRWKSKKNCAARTSRRKTRLEVENTDEGWEGGEEKLRSETVGSVVLLQEHGGKGQGKFNLPRPLIHKPCLLDRSYLAITKTSKHDEHFCKQNFRSLERVQSIKRCVSWFNWITYSEAQKIRCANWWTRTEYWNFKRLINYRSDDYLKN